MKKINHLLLLATFFWGILFFLSSCGKDDEDLNEDSYKSKIVGTWQGIKTEGFGLVNYYEDETAYLVFKEDGRMYDIVIDEDGEVTVNIGTWTAKTNGFTGCYTSSSDPDANSYIKGMTFSMDIIELTSSKLVCDWSVLNCRYELKKVSDNVVEKYIK